MAHISLAHVAPECAIPVTAIPRKPKCDHIKTAPRVLTQALRRLSYSRQGFGFPFPRPLRCIDKESPAPKLTRVCHRFGVQRQANSNTVQAQPKATICIGEEKGLEGGAFHQKSAENGGAVRVKPRSGQQKKRGRGPAQGANSCFS